MNQELEPKINVAEQVEEANQLDEAISAEYSLNPDGEIEIVSKETEKLDIA